MLDISSFANTSGGDIIYGIGEVSGVPSTLDGVHVDNLDILKQQIENIIRDGLEPRISGYSIKEIQVNQGLYFIIIRIPKSWISPHRVKFNNSGKFYGRNTNGKYELDVSELRRDFTLTESISIKLKQFREDRILKIISEDTPVKLSGERKVVMHIVPLISLVQTQLYDISILSRNKELAKPLCASGWDAIFNFDGIISFDGHLGGDIKSYTQFYKSGIIEAVTTRLEYSPDGKQICIPSSSFEKHLFEALRVYSKVFKEIRVDYPVYLFLTLINYQGSILAVHNSIMHFYDSIPVDRYILPFPEVYIENQDFNFHSILKPIFDTLWNTCGYERCLNYEQDGSYNPK